MSAEQKMLCLVCGTNNFEDSDPKDRFRTFSFGPTEDSSYFAVICFVCKEHKDVGVQWLRKKFYNEVFQAREWESSALAIVENNIVTENVQYDTNPRL